MESGLRGEEVERLREIKVPTHPQTGREYSTSAATCTPKHHLGEVELIASIIGVELVQSVRYSGSACSSHKVHR